MKDMAMLWQWVGKKKPSIIKKTSKKNFDPFICVALAFASLGFISWGWHVHSLSLQHVVPMSLFVQEQLLASKNRSVLRLNLNTASWEDLLSLPGVGPRLARMIMLQREQKAFAKVEDLLTLKGIGPKKYATLAPLVEV